jgi:predicted nucleic-acid-binding Zn-ribbon protein
MAISAWRAKIAKARDMDRHCLLFGAQRHRYQLGECATEDEVRRFEKQQGVELPSEYREFICTVGNGGAGPGYGIVPLEKCWIRGALHLPFPYTAACDPLAHLDDSHDDSEWNRAYNGCMAIGTDGCGIWNLLVVTGPRRGDLWKDLASQDQGFSPTTLSFVRWYEAWLDGIVSDELLEKQLEDQWRRATCLGFPHQCPKCFGHRVQTTPLDMLECNTFVAGVLPVANPRYELCTCLECGYSVKSYFPG